LQRTQAEQPLETTARLDLEHEPDRALRSSGDRGRYPLDHCTGLGERDTHDVGALDDEWQIVSVFGSQRWPMEVTLRQIDAAIAPSVLPRAGRG
jgi:hypothetical protein